MNLKKNGKVFRSKFVGTGPSSYENRMYRAAVSQRMRNTALYHVRQFLIHMAGPSIEYVKYSNKVHKNRSGFRDQLSLTDPN